RKQYCLPTAIYFSKKTDAPIIFGEDALKMLPMDPQNVIYDVKRLLGRRMYDLEVAQFQDTHMFKVMGDTYPRIWVPNRKMWISPEQALAIVLVHLIQMASSSHFQAPYIRDVLVSIPAYFHNAQRKSVRSACQLAGILNFIHIILYICTYMCIYNKIMTYKGLNLLKLVVEPTAAALAYSYYSATPKDNYKQFLTFDCGGGTTDCSILACTGMECRYVFVYINIYAYMYICTTQWHDEKKALSFIANRVLGTEGNSSLGGIDFDDVIREILFKKFKDKHGRTAANAINAQIRRKSEKVKLSLTENDYEMVDFKYNDAFLSVKITRDEFETHPRTLALVQQAIETAKRAIANARMERNASIEYPLRNSNVRMILMVGGTSKLPILQKKLREEFESGQSREKLGLDKLKIVIPQDDLQLMVVKGVSIIAGSYAYGCAHNPSTCSLDNIYDEPILEDVLPLDLGLSVCKNGTKFVCLFNLKYPAKSAPFLYCQRFPESQVVTLKLYEGDDKYAKNNHYLGELEVTGVPPRTNDQCDTIL
ncbi:hypothetical protein RFI_25480, partial [Reticulomyxa filosa]